MNTEKRKNILPYAFVSTMLVLALWLVHYNKSGADIKSTPACTGFSQELSLEESGNIETSSNDCWWLDSGATFTIHDGVAHTGVGEENIDSRWRKLYAVSNPTDTDGGLFPQNLFRLINRGQWQDIREQVFFRVDAYHLSSSPNRGLTNGVFLFARYINADNLYIAGMRVDGTAVIKRKFNGVYETLGTVSLANPDSYDKDSNPSLLPTSTWIGMALKVLNRSDGGVSLSLDISYDEGNTWTTALSVNDFQTLRPEGKILSGSGHAGIRTDFMDASFKRYSIGLIP